MAKTMTFFESYNRVKEILGPDEIKILPPWALYLFAIAGADLECLHPTMMLVNALTGETAEQCHIWPVSRGEDGCVHREYWNDGSIHMPDVEELREWMRVSRCPICNTVGHPAEPAYPPEGRAIRIAQWFFVLGEILADTNP